MVPRLAPPPVARRGLPFAVVATICTGALLLAPTPALLSAPPAAAAGGRLTETVSLRLVRKSGSSYVHSGTASGSVAGTVRSTLRLDSLSLRGTATVRNRRGTLRLRIDGRARSAATRAEFDGSVRVTGGTGAYRDAVGSGRFDGVVNRKTWAATIKATGSLRY
jgi:hypothetical protein